MRYARCRGLVGRQELWHEIAAMAVARSVTDLHPVGSSNSDKLVIFFLSKLHGGAAQGFFFFFFSILSFCTSVDHP
jgi:hypothetical protein